MTGVGSIALLLFAFFVSGASALAFEALWFHQAGLAFGNSVWASSLVLAAFMAGLALGSGIAARLGDRPRSALQTYATLELIVASIGIALVYALPQLGAALAPLRPALENDPAVLHALRFGVAFALLLAPSAAMGATLPLLTRALGGSEARFGRVLGLLYGANTLGAVCGVLLTEFVCLGALGIRGTAWVAGASSTVAAGLAWMLAADPASRAAPVADGTPGTASPQAPAETPATAPVARDTATGAHWLACAAVSGFALLALEVVWLRFLMLFVNDSPGAFAIVLACVLAGIALGGLAASVWAARSERAHVFAGLVAYATGLFGVAGYLVYPYVFQRAFDLDQPPRAVLAIAAPLVMPASLASGALFTLLGAGLRRALRSDAAAAGRLTLANTLGAALGPLIAGFVLLPTLGMDRSMFLLFALYGVIGLWLLWRSGTGAQLAYPATFVFIAGISFFPLGKMREAYVDASARRWMTGDDSITQVRETSTATIVRIRHRFAGLPVFDQLATNAYSMTVDHFDARRYMKLFVLLPVAIHARIERALVIGYGMGNTAAALVDDPTVQHVDVVDTSRDMLEMSRDTPSRAERSPLDDARVRVHIEDGRYFLQSTGARFDLVTGEPPPPIMAGVANLYSREYFSLVRARLNEGGIATYWLPMMNITAATARSIIRAFCDAFDDCSLWNGAARNFMLMGTRNAGGPVSAAAFVRTWNDADEDAIEELRNIGLEMPGELGALFIGDAEYLAALTQGALPVTDDDPRRILQPGTRDERNELMWAWRDTAAARRRFQESALIRRLWPPELLPVSGRYFENQRLLNDLLHPEPTRARQVPVLDQVLTSTPLRFPIVLMLNSDPDLQHALARATPAERERPVFLPHRIAGRLAERDFAGALDLVHRADDSQLPLPRLREYVEQMARADVPE